MANEFKTDIKILPIKAILKSLDIDEEKLLLYEEKTGIKPETIKGKSYYSIDDLEELKKVINRWN